MKERPLIKTNAYLKDAKLYKKMLFVNVASSSAIELGRLTPALVKALKKENVPSLISSPFHHKRKK